MTSHRDYTYQGAPVAYGPPCRRCRKIKPLYLADPDLILRVTTTRLSPLLVNLSSTRRKQSPFCLSTPAFGHPRSRLSTQIRNMSDSEREMLVVTLRDARA